MRSGTLKPISNYSIIDTEKKKFTIRATLKEISPKLNNKTFFRSHKSYTVNLTRITALESDLVFIDDEELPIGRKQSQELSGYINKL